ncbi:hypothetical protein EG68_07112 [Paragonimus skrjabini miyazakii]|uniref:Uncharacterized protein n=1 Tax=Paragonimus skrjabini miyazakii TaxID=59628 RepID=A0A8S9YKC4_9TREM|nr:hypothetical protein EG68_07112 [Paragonimus skrjabini miyazakii]
MECNCLKLINMPGSKEAHMTTWARTLACHFEKMKEAPEKLSVAGNKILQVYAKQTIRRRAQGSRGDKSGKKRRFFSRFSHTSERYFLESTISVYEAGLLDIREGEKLEVIGLFLEPRLLVRNSVGEYGLVRSNEVEDGDKCVQYYRTEGIWPYRQQNTPETFKDESNGCLFYWNMDV